MPTHELPSDPPPVLAENQLLEFDETKLLYLSAELVRLHARTRTEQLTRAMDELGMPLPPKGRWVRATVLAVASLDQKTLLDVTLRREGKTRRWSIVAAEYGWHCRVEGPGTIALDACATREEADAQVREWQREIDSARADGWA
jgi:hypothetical protein